MRGVILVPVSAVVLLTAAATALAGHSAFPPSVYAAPVLAAGHALDLCPSAAGLEPFDAAATKLARQAAAAYGRESLATDLRNSDRSWWLTVRRMWKPGRPHQSATFVLGSGPAATSGYQVFLEPACGASIVKKSLVVTIGPDQSGPGPHCNACRSHLFFVDRRGRPLFYFLY